MVQHKYGDFSPKQLEDFKTKIRKKIFWLILYKDENTNYDYKNVDVKKYLEKLMGEISGFNSLLFCPTELVSVLVNLESALLELDKPQFNFKTYKKYVLDAGDDVSRLKVGDDNGNDI